MLTPLNLTLLKLNTAGSTIAADIDNAHVYYTGSTPVFDASTPFGSAVATPSGTYYVTGSQQLARGANYFWVAYDVNINAGVSNVLDGKLDSLEISGVNYTPIN